MKTIEIRETGSNLQEAIAEAVQAVFQRQETNRFLGVIVIPDTDVMSYDICDAVTKEAKPMRYNMMTGFMEEA